MSHMRRPEFLYRYRSLSPDPHDDALEDRFERELSAITESYIWCSNYRKMNDPMEGYYWAEFSKRRQSGEVRAFKEGKLQVGLASFSEKHDNDLMWTHYAGNSSGICIEYEYSLLSESVADLNRAILVPMVYSSELIAIGDNDTNDREDAVRRILRQKKACWAYEEEWRLMADLKAQHIIDGTISKIYLGPRIDPRQKERLIEQAKGVAHAIEVLQMKVSGYEHVWEPVDQ